ncbi:hypothetical protein Q5692_06145 [Microcoleus sp. C2C3]|uniref:hypothetical protein n=1 Tax=Microcoleus sp. C2C6 TaxID=3055325 RepID=UPI002FD32D1F
MPSSSKKIQFTAVFDSKQSPLTVMVFDWQLPVRTQNEEFLATGFLLRYCSIVNKHFKGVAGLNSPQ